MTSLIPDVGLEDTVVTESKRRGYIAVGTEALKKKIPLITGTNQPDILRMQDEQEKSDELKKTNMENKNGTRNR